MAWRIAGAMAKLWARKGAYARWLASPWVVWVPCVLNAVALIYALYPRPTELRMAMTGLALQVLGTGVGFFALNGTRRLFDLPTFAGALRAWWDRRPRSRTVKLDSAATSITGGQAKLSLWFDMGAELDVAKRIEALVANVTQLRKEAAETDAAHTAAMAAIRTDLAARVSAADLAVADVSRRLKESQTSGIAIAMAALATILVGTLLEGLAPYSCAL